MKAPKLAAAIITSCLALVGCTTTQEPATEGAEAQVGQTYEFETFAATAAFREQLLPSLELEKSSALENTSFSAQVTFRTPGGAAPLAAWSVVQSAADLEVSTTNPGGWNCSDSEVVGDARQLICTADEKASAGAIAAGLPLTVVTPSKPGFFGITVQAGYGLPETSPLGWEALSGRGDAIRSLVKVVSPVLVAPQFETKAANLQDLPSQDAFLSTSTVSTVMDDEAGQFQTASKALTVASLDSFCLLYGAIGLSGGSISAGPMQFSSLGGSSASGNSCDSSSVITLKSADIQLGSVTFSDVDGTITPTSITISTAVVDGQVQLTMAGPYPDTGAEYSATAKFEISGTPIVASGSVDYSVANQLTIDLGISASSMNWAPLPGFSLGSAGAEGTFVRSGSGASETDTFDLELDFSGNWNPIGTVATKSLTVDLNNTGGELVASLDTSFSGGIEVSDINLSLENLDVSGAVDLDTGRTELDVSLGKLAVGKIAEIDQATVNLVYDPEDAGGGSSVFVSGVATFEEDIASFFAGDSVETTIEFNDAGYLVTAELETAPSTPGFTLSSLQFVYTSLIDPTVPFEYEPNYPDASGVLIPLVNEAPLVIAISKALPASFAKALEDLEINVIDPNSISVLAMGLEADETKFALYYGAPDQPFLVGSASDGTYLRFDEVFLSVEVGVSDNFTIGGDVTLHTDNTDLLLQSALEIEVSETGAGIDGYLELIDTSGWQDAFTISGLTIFDLLIQAGVDDGLPSFGVEATASFPASVTAPLGIVSGSVITLGLDLSATTPCAIFDIAAPSSNPSADVISLDGGSLTAKDAQMILAPEGCLLGTQQYSGFALKFDGAIRDVVVGFNTTFELSPAFTLQGSGYIGSFPMGSVTMEDTEADLSIGADGFSLVLKGGLKAGSSLQASGTVLLASNGGFTFDGDGQLFINGNGSKVSVHATDCKDIACTGLTDPSFNITGVVVINAFEFDAALSADADGNFKAKLTIPNQHHSFSFKHSNPTVDGNGTFTYTISVEVSNTDVGEVDFSGSVKLNSCKLDFGISCSGSKVTWSDKMSPGSVEVTIGVDIVGNTYRSSFKV